jgi:hypothetical protein
MKRILTAAGLALAIVSCGEEGPTGPGGNDNEMSATVGGTPFEAFAPDGNFAQGVVAIMGTQTSGAITTAITINVVDPEQGAAIPLNPNFAGSFGMVTVTDGSLSPSSWTTTLSPGTGSITFSTLNSERAIGTFQFTGQAAPGTSATGQKMVTSGTFDIKF